MEAGVWRRVPCASQQQVAGGQCAWLWLWGYTWIFDGDMLLCVEEAKYVWVPECGCGYEWHVFHAAEGVGQAVGMAQKRCVGQAGVALQRVSDKQWAVSLGM